MKIDVNWVKTVYNSCRGWPVGNMVQWKGVYYICFVDGTGRGILPISDNQVLIAYYSSHEYAPGDNHGSNVYLASVSLT